ncbi:hypothetical protein BDR03DRAFT_33576 [Suillus americanus]|nr:hypothetical protein BDR03DRAFT_33576 [Suillus americanus]
MSLFRPTHPDSDAHTPSRPRPFHFVRNYLSGKSGGADIELDLPVVEVTCQTHRRVCRFILFGCSTPDIIFSLFASRAHLYVTLSSRMFNSS